MTPLISLVAIAAAVTFVLASISLAALLRGSARFWRAFIDDRPEAFEDAYYWSIWANCRLGDAEVFVPAALLARKPERGEGTRD